MSEELSWLYTRLWMKLYTGPMHHKEKKCEEGCHPMDFGIVWYNRWEPKNIRQLTRGIP